MVNLAHVQQLNATLINVLFLVATAGSVLVCSCCSATYMKLSLLHVSATKKHDDDYYYGRPM